MNHRIDSGVRHQAARGLQVLWLAFVGSIGFYLLIILLLSQQSDTVEREILDVLRPAFWVLASILAIASFVWRQQVADLDWTRRRRTTNSGFARLRVACVVTWSLCEAIAVLGLCLGAISYRFIDYAPLVTAGLVLLFVHRPAAWPLERFLLEDLRR